MRDEFWLTDLRCALPDSAWTDADDTIDSPPAAPAGGRWRAVQYRAGEHSGHCLQTSSADSCVVQVPLPAEAQGWFAISLGMAGHYDQSVLDVRLSGQPWQTLRAGNGGVQNVPWLLADVQGHVIELRYPQDISQIAGRLRAQALSARVFWVHLRALSKQQISSLQHGTQKPLVYLNDGHSLFYWDVAEDEPISAELVKRSVRRFADSEWQTLCFCNGGADLVNYPSKVGTLFGEAGWDLPRATDKKVHRLMRGLVDQGHDTLEIALSQAQQQGHQRWFYIRPQAWVGEPPFDHAFRSRFFSENPQWRCRGRDGRALGKMSIAFSAVRQQLNTILQEGLDRGADGLAIALVRALPLAWYEQPVLQQLTDWQPDETPPEADDPRLLKIWGQLFEAWLIEIRQMLQRAGPLPDGQPRRLAIIGGATHEWHQNFGIDLAELARRGCFDVFMAYPVGSEDGEIDVAGLATCFAGTGVELLPSLGDWRDQGMPLAEIRQRAHDYYQQGADGLCRWDTSGLLIGPQLQSPALQSVWVDILETDYRPLREFAGLNLEEWPALDGF